MAQRLSAQELAWEWVDGVRIATMEDIPPEERNDLEAYGVARLKQAPEYVCRVTGVQAGHAPAPLSGPPLARRTGYSFCRMMRSRWIPWI